MHAPKNVYDIDRIVFQTLFFQTLGFIGYCTVKSGELSLPDFDGAAAVYIRENTVEEEDAVSQEILIWFYSIRFIFVIITIFKFIAFNKTAI